MKIKLSPKNSSFVKILEHHGSEIVRYGRTFRYFPYWVEETDGGLFLYHLDDLPDELKQAIKDMRL